MTLFDVSLELPTRDDDMVRAARISDDGLYRYTLHRTWGAPGKRVVFVMLNPSTADADLDDPTIRRCIAFARAWGYGGLDVVNLFAWRATDPKHLMHAVHPVGRENDRHIARVCRGRDVIAAWGASLPKGHTGRVSAVLELLSRTDAQIHDLGTTKAGHPRHPLYLRNDVRPRRWDS